MDHRPQENPQPTQPRLEGETAASSSLGEFHPPAAPVRSKFAIFWNRIRRWLGLAMLLGPISMVALVVYTLVDSSDHMPDPISISIVFLQILVALVLRVPTHRIALFLARVVVVLEGVIVAPSGLLLFFASETYFCYPPFSKTCRTIDSLFWVFFLTLPLGVLIILAGIVGILPERTRPSDGFPPTNPST